MKITIYTISDCQFSQAEKEYLKKHNLSFEEKNLEQNREWLNEMLTLSNNFAGTPVTKIEKDDGKIEVLKGFTQEEFDQVLGFKKEESVTQTSAGVNLSSPSQPPQPSPNQPTTATLTNQPPAQSPTQSSPPPVAETPQPVNPEPQILNNPVSQDINKTQTNQYQASDPLNSILNNLQKKATAGEASNNQVPPYRPDNSSSNQPLPNIPNPDFK